MGAPLELRCELDAERLARAAPELGAALFLWTSRHQEALRVRRERLEPLLRWTGLGLSALGALVSGAAVAVLPDAPCAPRAGLFYQVATPVFALLGVVFWFMPRISERLRAWAPSAAARRAPRLLSRLPVPNEVTYRLAGGRLESRLARPRRTRATPLSAVAGAVVGETLVCLFGRPPFSRLLRVVWLTGDPDRQAVLSALREAGVPLHALPPAAPP